MTRTKIFAAALTAALILPMTASAHCSTMNGSFAVSCENGVTVYRHQALSGIPADISPERARLKAEEMRAQTARAQIASNARIAAANAKLRERELAIKDYRARVYDRNTRRRSTYLIGGGYGFNTGYRRARVRPVFRAKR